MRVNTIAMKSPDDSKLLVDAKRDPQTGLVDITIYTNFGVYIALSESEASTLAFKINAALQDIDRIKENEKKNHNLILDSILNSRDQSQPYDGNF